MARIADSSSTNAVNIGAHNETFSVVATRVCNIQIVRPVESIAVTQPQLQSASPVNELGRSTCCRIDRPQCSRRRAADWLLGNHATPDRFHASIARFVTDDIFLISCVMQDVEAIFDRFGCQLLLVCDREDAIVSTAGSEPDWHPVRSLGIIVHRKVFGTI
jgi:hypothetical protein